MVFTEAVSLTCDIEGPLSFESDGSPTKWGIRSSLYPEVLRPDFSRVDAINLYLRDYWNKVDCDKFPPQLRFMLFECAVNQGQVTAIRLLQKALKVKQDGIVGPITIQAAMNAGQNAIDEFTVRRIGLYVSNARFMIDGLGWLRRLIRAYRYCIQSP